MRTLAIACAAALLCSCSSKTADAEEQYNIVSNSGTVADKCMKARDVQQAYLSSHDERGFAHWKAQADAACADVNADTAALPANPKQQADAVNAMANAAEADANEALREAEKVQHSR